MIRIALVSIGTVTSWSVVTVRCTERVDTALSHQAGVHALVVDARLGQRALAVPATSNLGAVSLRIAGETFVANTDCTV